MIKIGNYNIRRVTNTEKNTHEYHLTDGLFWCIAWFKSKGELDKFAETLGFTYKEIDRFQRGNILTVIYGINKMFDDAMKYYFWSVDQLPKNAKPVRLMDNGDMVTCYFTNENHVIRIYRPNPNVKELRR